MFINFHAHPLHILRVINIFAIDRFFFPLVYLYLYIYLRKALAVIQVLCMSYRVRVTNGIMLN